MKGQHWWLKDGCRLWNVVFGSQAKLMNNPNSFFACFHKTILKFTVKTLLDRRDDKLIPIIQPWFYIGWFTHNL